MARTSRNSSTELASDISVFAAHLQTRISDGCSPIFSLDTESVCRLNKHIDRLPLTSSSLLPVSSRCQLDSTGTALWNACTRLMRLADREWEVETIRLLSRVKVLAFLMLESGAPSEETGEEIICSSTERTRNQALRALSYTDEMRLLKVALKATKLCLESRQLDLSLKILEIAAVHVELLENAGGDAESDSGQALAMEYYMLRIVLSWRQNRLDLAEHMFSKLAEDIIKKDPDIAETLADTCYDIGKWALSTHQAKPAVIWLDRALKSNTLWIQGVQKQNPDGNDMRLVILHTLVRANLELNTEESWGNIRETMDALNKEYGNKFPVQVLNLEVHSRQTGPGYQAYYNTLETVIQTAEITETNIKVILYYMQKLKVWSVELSAQALQQLLLQRLALTNNESWLEQGFISLIWTVTTSVLDLRKGLGILKDTVVQLSDCWRQPLSAAATHASLILLWKKIDSLFSQANFTVAEEWCRFAQHSIFQLSKPSNKAKIQRKLILCALGNSNTSLARRTFNEMNEDYKADPLITYLMYRVALQDKDLDLGKSCLKSLCEVESGQSYILACVTEAQRSGNRRQATIALQQLLERLNYGPGEGIHLPALLRCTVRLLVLELKDNEANDPEAIEQICRIFEASVTQIIQKEDSLNKNAFSTFELEWFSRNSYNLALELCASWPPGPVIRLLNVSIKLIDLYPKDIGSEARSDTCQRRLLCDFLGAVIMIAQARAQNELLIKEEQYIDVRIHVQSFRGRIQPQLDRSDESSHRSWLNRYRAMISFDFEALVQLKQWNSLSPLIEEARAIADGRMYAIFADAVLCSEAPIEVRKQVLEQIIHAFRTSHSPHLTSYFREKLPRYFRCLFQLALDHVEAEQPTPGAETALAESVLDRAYIVARDIQHSQERQSSYPDEELEWLATMAFNRAVDFYLVSLDEDSRRWGRKAIELAELMQGDGGTLVRVLRGKFDRLW